MSEKQIYLASSSPRRRELLEQIGIVFELLPMDAGSLNGVEVDETPLAGEAPVAYVTRVARAKAESGWRQIMRRGLPELPVLAADTAVVLNGEIIGKPDNAQQAQQFLSRLSAKTHQVLTAVAVAQKESIETALSTSAVEFRQLGDDEIRRYVASGEPLDKAGAYAIQGRAAVFVRAMSGSYSGVVGLPLFETAQLLSGYGL